MLAPQVIAIYARVSSEQQADAHTIGSQVAALRDRVAADGLTLAPAEEFIDEGYSGATLVRPSLERLRDLAAAGGARPALRPFAPIDWPAAMPTRCCWWTSSRQAGVEVVVPLNRALGQTPEDDLLLQVQGHDRRVRAGQDPRAEPARQAPRGAPWARSTSSGRAPYGYRYVRKYEGGGEARYEIVLDEARDRASDLHWVGGQRLSIGEVSRRLKSGRERTRTRQSWSGTGATVGRC